MTRRLVFALGLALASVPLVGVAQEAELTRLFLTETATREVEQDTLVARLAARAEAASAREAQAAVNAAISAAIEKAEAVEGLERATGIYRVSRRRDREGRETGWVAEQELRLETGDAPPLLSLVGELQDDGLLLKGLAYELSREARRALQDDLTAQAIDAIEVRAGRIAAAMELAVQRFATLRVGSVGEVPPVRPLLEARTADAATAAPRALPDREMVDVTIEAEVELAPR